MKRIFFIPGFGEDPSIFDKIHPHISGEKIFLDNWKLLGDRSRKDLNVLQYARELVEQFNISREDVVIGHSMGGWIAYHIRHLVQCPTIQISSWTDGRKVKTPVRKRFIIYGAVRSGLVYNALTKRLLVWRDFRNKPSRGVFSSVVDNLISGSRNNVINQLRVIFNPTNEEVREEPDLRIHARGDTIIRYPDQPAVEVPGDHFSLYIYPEKVYAPIIDILNKGRKPV